jgi:hypothetical protein
MSFSLRRDSLLVLEFVYPLLRMVNKIMTGQSSVVLIDDDQDKLIELRDALVLRTGDDDVIIKVWKPTDGEDPYAKFDEVIDGNAVLVVTDYDLTKAGLTGLFGVSIVSWCQARFIPVGDFSRANVTRLPREPNLFELRVPTGIDEAARYTADMFRGFRDLRAKLDNGSIDLTSVRSPAEVLAAVIGRPTLESQLALYMSLLGGANASLFAISWADSLGESAVRVFGDRRSGGGSG